MRTQAALYDEIDLELSWSEAELPERERTKHVHRLHPYLGKYVPQLVEVFLQRYGRPGRLVWDPFAGSGTTLVEANAFGAPAAGCDISAFNCLLTRVKTAVYEREPLLADAARLADAGARTPAQGEVSPYLSSWFAPRALAELLAFRDALEGTSRIRISGGSSCPARRARPGSPATSISTSRRSRCRGSTSATSTGARAAP